MRGKMRVSLPEKSGSDPTKTGPGDDRCGMVRGRVAAREKAARSMDVSAKQKAEKGLNEAQICLDRYMNEWKMLQEGKADPSVSKFIIARRTHLLKNISDMRKKVNSEMSKLYCNELVDGGTLLLKVGKSGYPDLNNSSSAVMALQRVGLPVIMDDMPVITERTHTDECMGDDELSEVLMTFKDLGAEGWRCTFTMNNTRDEVSIRLLGSTTAGRSGSLKGLIGPDLSEMEGCRIIIERPVGSGNHYNATEVGKDGLIQLEPVETESIRESMAIPLGELAEEWSAGRSGLTVRAPSGPMGHIRTALQVASSLLLKSAPVIIEMEGPDGKGSREYLVDDLDMAMRKVVLIDPLKPRGAEKTETFYGRDLDNVLERWGARSYIITTFKRNVPAAEGT